MAKEKKKKEGMRTGLVPWGGQVHTSWEKLDWMKEEFCIPRAKGSNWLVEGEKDSILHRGLALPPVFPTLKQSSVGVDWGQVLKLRLRF